MGRARIEIFKDNLKRDILSPLQHLSLDIPSVDEYVTAYREIISELLVNTKDKKHKLKLADKLYQNSIEKIETNEKHTQSNTISLMLEGAHNLYSDNSAEKARTALVLASELESSHLHITTDKLEVKDQLLVQDIYQLAEVICSLYQEVFSFGNDQDKIIAAYRLYAINNEDSKGTLYLDYIINYLLSTHLRDFNLLESEDPLQVKQLKNSMIDRLIELKSPDEIAEIFNKKDNALLRWLASKDESQLDELKKYNQYVDSSWKEIEAYQNKIQKELTSASLEGFLVLPVNKHLSFIKAYQRVINKLDRARNSSEKDKLANKFFENCIIKISQAVNISKMPPDIIEKILLLVKTAYYLYSIDLVAKAKVAVLYAVLSNKFKQQVWSSNLAGMNIYRLYHYAFQYGDEEAKTFAACQLYKMNPHCNNRINILEQIINYLYAKKSDFDYLLPEINDLFYSLLDQGILFSITQYLLAIKSPEEVGRLLAKDNLLQHRLRNAVSPLASFEIAFDIKGDNLLEVLKKYAEAG